jgi:hypothetical protein
LKVTTKEVIKIFLNEETLERLIEYVFDICDPLLCLIRRAEDLLLRSSDNQVCCDIYADELKRLSEIQEEIGNKSGYDRDLHLLLKILSEE